MALSDTKLRKISGKPYDGQEELPDGQGLSVRISPKGLITYQPCNRIPGALKRLRIGNHPDVSLKDRSEEHTIEL